MRKRVELARRDTEAGQILGLQLARIFPSLYVGKQRALDMAE